MHPHGPKIHHKVFGGWAPPGPTGELMGRKGKGEEGKGKTGEEERGKGGKGENRSGGNERESGENLLPLNFPSGYTTGYGGVLAKAFQVSTLYNICYSTLSMNG